MAVFLLQNHAPRVSPSRARAVEDAPSIFCPRSANPLEHVSLSRIGSITRPSHGLRPGAPCCRRNPFRRGREQSECEEAVSMRDLPAGFLGALGAELAHGCVEMLRADDEALEGCGTRGLGLEEFADRGKTCLAADQLDIGT